jgi:predicted ferric reductase
MGAMKTMLLSSKVSLPQGLLLGAWYVNLLIVTLFWAKTAAPLLTGGKIADILLATGQILGIYAAVFALTQFLFMGRIIWIEKHFGLDRLASYHRFNGYAAILLIILHPIFIVASYTIAAKSNYITQYIATVKNYEHAFLAFIGQILFIIVVASSIYIARKHLKFENWYYVHLAVYAAIVLAFLHQISVGSTFLSNHSARYYWLVLYGFVGFSVLYWRFITPVLKLSRHSFKITKVVSESPTTTSVYISGNNLEKLNVKPGQFVMIRVLNAKYILEEHPFSVSAIPKNGQFRLTIRQSGDYTSKIAQLKPGSTVLVSGPFGRFIDDIAVTPKRLFIAGGVGITPLGTLARSAIIAKKDSALIYGNRTPDDVALKSEIDTLADHGLKTTYVYSNAPTGFTGETGYVTADLVERLTPDYMTRDIFICGPPVMMEGIVKGLLNKKFPAEQLHFEQFSLHS